MQTTNSQKTIYFPAALIGDKWETSVVVGVDGEGWISGIWVDRQPTAEDEIIPAVALPGMVNAHSHAFQRAFAGLSEFRTVERDSFWTWRQLMYDFLEKLTPDDVFVIARQLYLEMLLAGYTWVGEFHYLHHDRGGARYQNLAEMSEVLCRAASESGIGLCLLPVLYQRGGFGSEKLAGGQLRFGLDADEFLALLQLCRNCLNSKTVVGAALHSLRAVDVVSANEILPGVRSLFENCPLHIHVAEQIQEVLDCQAAHGQRPVDFLYDSLPVDETWSLIHATHLTTGEIGRIIDSNATICLCPTTEANLGDGFFAADKYTANNGRFCIGSDSHCSIDLREELRTLEYGQRLQRRERAILTAPNQSVGRYLYQLSAEGGGRAIGIKTGRIAVGYRADFTLVDPDHPAIAGSEGDALIDRLVFCNADDPIAGAVVGGVEYSLQVPDFLELVYDSQNEFNRLARRLSQ